MRSSSGAVGVPTPRRARPFGDSPTTAGPVLHNLEGGAFCRFGLSALSREEPRDGQSVSRLGQEPGVKEATGRVLGLCLASGRSESGKVNNGGGGVRLPVRCSCSSQVVPKAPASGCTRTLGPPSHVAEGARTVAEFGCSTSPRSFSAAGRDTGARTATAVRYGPKLPIGTGGRPRPEVLRASRNAGGPGAETAVSASWRPLLRGLGDEDVSPTPVFLERIP